MGMSGMARELIAMPIVAAALLLSPPSAAAQQPPSRLGIDGHFEHGYGFVLHAVRWRSPAARIGLEPGDVIRAVEGRWLRTPQDLRRELLRNEGTPRLIVEDVRTGRLISRPIDLSGSPRRSSQYPGL
jgi:S1-C subfamily serine protease